MSAGRIISSWLALGPTGSNLSLEELASKNSFERKGVPPMTRREAEQLLQILKGWTLADGSIGKEFRFRSYLDGLDFAYLVGKMAEEQDHQPHRLATTRRGRAPPETHAVAGHTGNETRVAAGG